MNTERIQKGQWKRGYYGRIRHYFVDGKAVCGSSATAMYSDYGKSYPRCKKCDKAVKERENER